MFSPATIAVLADLTDTRPTAAPRSRRRRRRSGRRAASGHVGRGYTVRATGSQDTAAIARLVALDETTLPAGETLVAERDGVAIAVVHVASGQAAADPFEHTAAAVSEMRASARRLAASRSRRRRSVLRPRPFTVRSALG